MIDQERHAVFEGELHHYSVTLKVREKKLVITAMDSETRRRFRKMIDQQFIDRQDITFKANFESPEDLFVHLTEHFSDIVIEKGILRFSYTIGKKRLVRDVEIELEEQKVEEPAIGEQTIVKIKKEFTEELLQRDNRIQIHQLELLEFGNQLRQYKKQSHKSMEIIKERMQKQQNYSKGLEDRLQRLEDRLQKEERNNKNNVFRLELQAKEDRERLINDEKNRKNLMQRLQIFDKNTRYMREKQFNEEMKFKNIMDKLETQDKNTKDLRDRLQNEMKNCKILQERLQKEQNYSKKLGERMYAQENIIKVLESRLQAGDKSIKVFGERQQNELKNYKLLQEKLRKEQNLSRILADRLQIHEKDIRILQNQLQGVENVIKNLDERLKIQENIMTFMEKETENKIALEKMAKIEDIVHPLPELISHHPNNIHRQYYALTNSTTNSAKLIRVGGGNECYNFINRTQVLPNQHNKYAIKISKVKESNLMVGFCTEKGFGNINNYGNAESAYYYCHHNGQLWKGGVRKNLSGCGSRDGDILQCVADLLAGRMSWRKGGKVLLECAVPATMKNSSIYFSILLFYQGDQVEVNAFE